MAFFCYCSVVACPGFIKGSRRSMDRTQACGACNVGSIPTGSTNTIV